ncbi:MAG: hypothetical protein CMI16_11335 [Opitutaceae bacterium]|nr:hypothetical protein [Opitutaceae bacterium]|tara:strand:- start:434 stop:1921 length:1488 start_codon:yes stop_codon:yes gene_type:complete
MKTVFLGITIALSAMSFLLYWTAPDRASPIPVLYWITQDDEVKQETITLFKEWLDENNLPPVEVKIDNTNQGLSKKLTQGLAGVGADILDVYGNNIGIFAASGMLMDVTEKAQELGFGPDKTYPALQSDLIFDGKQYGFPRNAGAGMVWINKDTFARYGIEEPPDRWTWDDFERIGTEFVEAANPPGTRDRVYFMKPSSNMMSMTELRRGMGLSTFNETMTECILDDERTVEVMRRMYRWVVELQLIPTIADQNAMTADTPIAGGATFYLFSVGRYAMLNLPRWALIRLRPLGKLSLRVVEPPHTGFPNIQFGCGIVGAYTNTKYPEETAQFLQFLTSEKFNLLIARSGDSLPPVPKYTQTEEFLRPPDHPEEWQAGEVFSRAAAELGIPVCRPPFVLANVYTRIETNVQQSLLAGRLSPEAAAKTLEERINREIQISIKEDAQKRKLYDELKVVQGEIDQLKAMNRPIPREWITNPFYLHYYEAKGLLTEEGSG